MNANSAPQRFTISHLDDSAFKTGGLRDSAYRDLGMAAATGGFAEAHVIRMMTPFRPDLSERHHHNGHQFQMAIASRAGSRPTSKA